MLYLSVFLTLEYDCWSSPFAVVSFWGVRKSSSLAAAVLEALFGHLLTFFGTYTSPNTLFYERITSALTALHYFSFVRLFWGPSYESISVLESWQCHEFDGTAQLSVAYKIINANSTSYSVFVIFFSYVFFVALSVLQVATTISSAPLLTC